MKTTTAIACGAALPRREAALLAARAKNVDQVLASGDALYTVCENCHKKYMPQG